MFIDSDNVAVGPSTLSGVLESLSQEINFSKQQVISFHAFEVRTANNSFVPNEYTKIICNEVFNNGVTEGLRFDQETSEFYVRGDVSRMLIFGELNLYLNRDEMPNTTFPVNVRTYIQPYYYLRNEPDVAHEYSSHRHYDTFIGMRAFDTLHTTFFDAWSPSYSTERFHLNLYVNGLSDSVSVVANSTSKIFIASLWGGNHA